MTKRSGPLASPGYHLWTASLRWTSAIAEELAPLDLTHTQFFVIGTLRWLTKTEGRAPKVREVADFASLDRMMTSQVVRALEERELITRKDDPDDSRAWRLFLTRKGETLFQQAIERVRAVDERFFKGRSKSLVEELEALSRRGASPRPTGGLR
jgi:DNA-binding MarR family transcriptional regulator